MRERGWRWMMVALLCAPAIAVSAQTSTHEVPAAAPSIRWAGADHMEMTREKQPADAEGLLLFTVSGRENGAFLEWETVERVNAGFYQVQRSSNGVEWEIISLVRTTGWSEGVRQYQWYDEASLSGTSYYRVRRVDMTGPATNFPIVCFNAEQLQPLGYLEQRPTPY